ncbi:MAG: membrane protein insertion efficiency factor YidD [Myxococcota bacterium]
MKRASDGDRSTRRRWLIVAALVLAVLAWNAQSLTLLTIDGYQRWISPHKGYQCAHAQVHGGLSCSGYGEKAIRDEGLLQGVILLNRRFDACHEAAAELRASRSVLPEGDLSAAEVPGCEACGETSGDATGSFCGGFCEGMCDGR